MFLMSHQSKRIKSLEQIFWPNHSLIEDYTFHACHGKTCTKSNVTLTCGTNRTCPSCKEKTEWCSVFQIPPLPFLKT